MSPNRLSVMRVFCLPASLLKGLALKGLAVMWCWSAIWTATAQAQNIGYSANAIDQTLRAEANVDPSTLGMSFNVTLNSYPGRGLSLPVALSYSSKVWRMNYITTVQGPSHPITHTKGFFAQHSVRGWTTSLDEPYLEYTPQIYDETGNPQCTDCDGFTGGYWVERVVFHLPNGGTQQLRRETDTTVYRAYWEGAPPMSGIYVATDGSRLRLDYNTPSLPVVYMPDGSRYLLYTTGAVYLDRYGNKLTYSKSTKQWTDTLGRVFGFALTPGSTPNTQTVTLPGTGTSTLTYKFVWKNLSQVLTAGTTLHLGSITCGGPLMTYSPSLFVSTSSSDLACSNTSAFNELVLAEIWLPNHNPNDANDPTGKYKFNYTVYGEIDKVTLPTGGYHRYTYMQVAPLDPDQAGTQYAQSNRGVQDHYFSEGGGAAERRWQYSINTSNGYVVRATAHDNAKTERVIFTGYGGPGFGYEDARIGMATEERAFTAASQWIRRNLTDYTTTDQTLGLITTTRNPRPIRQTEILLDTGGNAQTKTTMLNYDNGYDLNVIERKHYDYTSVSAASGQIATINNLPLGTHLNTEKAKFLVNDSQYASVQGFYRNRNLVALPTCNWVETPAGAVTARTEYIYDEAGYAPLSNATTAVQWDNPSTTYLGTPTTVRRWLNVTHDANGNSTVNTYPNGEWLVTHTQTDVCGNVRKSWDARGKVSEIKYDGNFSDGSNHNAYAYPTQTLSAKPNPSNTNGMLGVPYAANQELTASTVYDFQTGKPLTVTDANGQVTTNSYANDSLQRLTKVTRPTGGGETIYEYNDVAGTCACDISVKTRSLQSGVSGSGTYLEDYVFFDGLGRAWRTAHKEAGGKWSVKDSQYEVYETINSVVRRTEKVANPYLTAVAYTIPNRASLGLVTADVTKTVYDELGRVLTVTTPDSSVVTTTYSGNQVTVADQANGTPNVINNNNPRNTTRRSVTDGLGRLVQVVEAPGSLGHTTNYTYDVLGNLVKVDQGGQYRHFMYDSLSRLVRAKNPEQDVNGSLALEYPVTGNTQWTLKYIYDENGNLTKRTDARDTTATYTYDDLNRNWKISYAGGTAVATPLVERYYDSATLGKGKLWQSVSYNLHPVTAQAARHRTQVTAYDALGRPTNAWQEFQNSAGQFVTYPYARSYDLTSHVTGQTYPSNRTVSYSYGTDGRLSSFSGTLGDGGSRTYADTMSYNAAGQMLQERFVTSTNLYHLMQYNSRHQMWDNRLGTTAGGWNRGALFTYYSVTARNSGIPGGNYSGNNGNVWMQEHYVPTDDGITSHTIFRDVYEYDDLNRIKRDTGWQKSTTNVWTTPHQQGFTYDQWGNRTIDAGQTFGTTINNIVFTPNTANNRLGGLSYDFAGNVTTDNITGAGLREYDAENRMTKANGTGGFSYYGYDADGRRVRRITSNGEVWHVYGFDGELLAEYPVNGAASTPQKEYGYRGGQMLVVGGCDVVRWTVADHLGSPRIEVDVTGALASVRRHDYLPFGEELGVGMGTGSARSTTNGYATDCVRQRFTGYERDDETGLDYARARYLGSRQGRFVSVDPAMGSGKSEQPQSWNRYSYVLNNPIKYIDPSGMIWGILKGAVSWYKDVDALQAAGATEYTEQYYETSDGRWVHLWQEGPNNNADLSKPWGQAQRQGWNYAPGPPLETDMDAQLFVGGAFQMGLGGLASVVEKLSAFFSGKSDLTITNLSIQQVPTPYGSAIQSLAPEAVAAREAIEEGALLFRGGTLGRSAGPEGQFWSLESPLSSGFAQRYGIPAENMSFDFIEYGVLKPGATFITRPAPGIGANLGGGIEAVVPANAVRLKGFATLESK